MAITSSCGEFGETWRPWKCKFVMFLHGPSTHSSFESLDISLTYVIFMICPGSARITGGSSPPLKPIEARPVLGSLIADNLTGDRASGGVLDSSLSIRNHARGLNAPLTLDPTNPRRVVPVDLAYHRTPWRAIGSQQKSEFAYYSSRLRLGYLHMLPNLSQTRNEASATTLCGTVNGKTCRMLSLI